MGQHQAQFAKRSGTSAILAKLAGAPDPDVTRSIPISLQALLEPYKRYEGLAIRIERVPQRARLSAGQNNGDRSWSLTKSDLDGLCYLVPADIDTQHSLSIRLIDRIEGRTVTVIDYTISPSAPSPSSTAPVALERRTDHGHHASADAARALEDELAATRRTLAEAETASAERLRQTEEEWSARAAEMVEKALAKARAEWDAEFSHRLKAIAERAESTLTTRRAAWQAEMETSLADAERRAEEGKRLARESWQRESEAALAKAQESWKLSEAQRLAAAEARWREELAAAQAAARGQSERQARDAADLTALRDQLAVATKAVGDRDAELARSRDQAARDRDALRREADAALAKAKTQWAAEEAGRLAAAEARLREEMERALADARARYQETEHALRDAERRADELANRNREATPAHEEAAALRVSLAAMRTELSETREQARRDVEARLTEAKLRWKSEEDARLSAAEARWREAAAVAVGEELARRERAEAALAEATRHAQSDVARRDDAELVRMRDEVRGLQAALARREEELVSLREQSRQTIERALAQAKNDWMAQDSVRLAQAEVRIRAELSNALEEAQQRCEAAERELAEAKSASAASKERVEVLRLRDELERLRINLELKDIELRQARSAAAFQPDGNAHLAPLPRGRMAMRDEPEEERTVPQKGGRSLVRDIVVVVTLVFLVALAPLMRPYVEPMLPYDWQDEIDSVFGDLYTPVEPASPSSTTKAPQPLRAPAPVTTDTVARRAKLHAGPSTNSAIVATLEAGTKVTRLETRGDWVHVSVAGDGNVEQGWIYNSYVTAGSTR